MLKNLDDRKKSMLYILGGLLMILVVYWPNFQEGIYTGHDLSYHFNRIDSLAESLRNGIFPVKWHATRAFGYGYGVGFFYCNFFLYLPAILINLGMDLLTSYKVFLFLVYIGIFTSMFFSTRKISGNNEAAFIASCMYLLSNKVMASVYVSGAVGEVTAFIFAPMAIAGMYCFLMKNEYPYMLIVGFCGLIFSHTISTFLIFVVCGLIVLVYLNRLFENKMKILHLISAVVIVALVTMCFWLPMLEQMSAQDLKVKYPWTVSEEHVELFRSIVMGELRLGYLITLVLVVSICGGVILAVQKKREELKCIVPFLSIALVMIYITTNKYFWHVMNSVLEIKFLQFPYRLFSSVTILVLFAFSVIYTSLECKIIFKRSLCVLLVGFGILVSYNMYSVYYLNTGFDDINAVIEGRYPGLGGGEEWLPIETQLDELVDSTQVFDDQGIRSVGEKINGCNQFIFEADMSRPFYDIPYVWYKGFEAIDSQGNPLRIDKNYETGMIRIYIDENRNENELITVYYKGTKYQKLAYAGSLLGICTVIIYIIVCKKDLVSYKRNRA